MTPNAASSAIASSTASPARLLTLLVLLGLWATTWAPRLHGPLDLRWDAATYYILGTSLAEGRGYRLLNEPGDIQAIQYPPLLPLIVATHQWAVGTSDPVIIGRWLRASFVLISVGFVLASYALFCQFLPAGYAFLATAVCHLGSTWTFLSDLLFPELLFGLAAVLFTLSHYAPPSRLKHAIGGVCVVLAYLLRTAGVALMIAWIGDSLVRKQFKLTAIRCVVAALPVLGWNAYIAHVQGESAYRNPAYSYQRAPYLFYNVSYASSLALRDPFDPSLGTASPRQLLGRVVRNSIALPQSLGESVSILHGYWTVLVLDRVAALGRVPPATTASVILVLLGAGVLSGVVLQCRRGHWVLVTFVVVYCGIVAVTPWPLQWSRYWAPLAPFLVLALSQALLASRDQFGRRLPIPFRRIMISMPAAVLCVLLVVESLTLWHFFTSLRGDAVLRDRRGQPVHVSLFYFDQAYRELDHALEWLALHARPDDVIAVSMPPWAHLITRTKTVMPPFEPDPDKAQALLDSVPVRYVVLDSTSVDVSQVMRRFTWPVVRSAPARWAPVYIGASGLATVYERVGQGAPTRQP